MMVAKLHIERLCMWCVTSTEVVDKIEIEGFLGLAAGTCRFNTSVSVNTLPLSSLLFPAFSSNWRHMSITFHFDLFLEV